MKQSADLRVLVWVGVKTVIKVIKIIWSLVFAIICCLVFWTIVAINDWHLINRWWAYLIVAALAINLVFGPRSGRTDQTGVIPISRVRKNAKINELGRGGEVRVAVLRQSGAEHRVFYVDSMSAAFDEIERLFKRKNVDKVRVWQNTHKILDVRMNYYHGRGSNEGRVISGIRLSR